jgi:hypothetical protein
MFFEQYNEKNIHSTFKSQNISKFVGETYVYMVELGYVGLGEVSLGWVRLFHVRLGRVRLG